MMTEHAPPISFRLGIAAMAAAFAALALDSGLNGGDFFLAISIGFVVWGTSYVAVYLVEQYLYETGRLTRPHWMTGNQHPVDEMLEFHELRNVERVCVDEADDNTAIERELMLPLTRLAQSVLWYGMDRISMRQLEANGVVVDRTGPTASRLIDLLVGFELLDDIGNSTYGVTDRLKEYLTLVTGVTSNEQRVRASTPEMAE